MARINDKLFLFADGIEERERKWSETCGWIQQQL